MSKGKRPAKKGKTSKPKSHNNLCKKYFRNPVIFADYVQGVSRGEVSFSPERYEEVDTTLLLSQFSCDGPLMIVTKEAIRDVAKKVTHPEAEEEEYFSMEIQSRYDRSMARRIALYDLLTLNNAEQDKKVSSVTYLLNFDKRPFETPLTLPSSGRDTSHQVKLDVAVYNVVDHINDEDRPEFNTELKVVFAYISGALNGMEMEEIEEKCSWVKGVTLSPEASVIVNLYPGVASSEETKQGVNFMARYQADIKRHAEELAMVKASEKEFTMTLNLSRNVNVSFEKAMELCGVPTENRPMLLERYQMLTAQ